MDRPEESDSASEVSSPNVGTSSLEELSGDSADSFIGEVGRCGDCTLTLLFLFSALDFLWGD